MKISYSDVQEVPSREFYAEASSLGIPPSEFPSEISTSMGNGNNFMLTERVFLDGDLVSVKYVQALGIITLEIMND